MPPVGLTKPPLALDFDGVLNTYASGFTPDYVPDPPVQGALEALTSYAPEFQLIIFSTRATDPEGVAAILDWLSRNGFGEIPITVTAVKPNAVAFLDDRGLNFPGPDQFPTVEELLAFRPWWDHGEPTQFPAIDATSAQKAVDSLHARASAASTAITDTVSRAVEFAGGSLSGLEERIKAPTSLAGKLANVMAEKNLDLPAAAADVKDALRYSAVFPASCYVAAGELVLELLENGAGLHVDRLRNYWLPDESGGSRYAEGTYLGINVVLRCPNGFVFELQFHTPQSLDVQALNWDFYRLIRSGGLSVEDRSSIEAQMRQNNTFVPVPADISSFATLAAQAGVPERPNGEPGQPAGPRAGVMGALAREFESPRQPASPEGTLQADATDGVSRGIPASAHYRDATDLDISCATCSYYGAGTNFHCGMWDEPVSPEKTCDDWAEGLPGALPTQWQWDELDEVTQPLTAAGEPFCLPEELRGVTDPLRMAFVEAVMTPALEEAGLTWNLSNPLAADVISRSGQHIVGISQTTQNDVMNVINVAHDQGLSIPDTAKAIESHMSEASHVRATMIARTEMTAAVNGGALAATKIAVGAMGASAPGGSGGTKTWMTAPGAMYPRHEDYDDLDGQTVALDDTFSVGEDQLQYPGDPDGSPGEVINCRCTMNFAGGSGALTGDNMDAAGARTFSFEKHNRLLLAAHKRIDELEPKLVAALEPIFVRAGKIAAKRFEQLATDHLTAAGPGWTPPAGEEILPINCGAPGLPVAQAATGVIEQNEVASFLQGSQVPDLVYHATTKDAVESLQSDGVDWARLTSTGPIKGAFYTTNESSAVKAAAGREVQVALRFTHPWEGSIEELDALKAQTGLQGQEFADWMAARYDGAIIHGYDLDPDSNRIVYAAFKPEAVRVVKPA